MSEERIKERCKREDIALKIVKGFLEKDCYTDTELEYSLNTLLDLYNKQKEEIERLKNAEEYTKLGKETLLDTIHRQKEEIEELNSEFAINTEIHKRDEEIKELKETIKCLHEPAENYISKDKIRDKIKRISLNYFKADYTINEVIEILNELLEEK